MESGLENDSRSGYREGVERQLARQMRAEEISRLRDLLEREADRRRRRVVLYQVLLRIYVVCAVGVLAANLLLKQHLSAFLAPMIWATIGVGLWCKRAAVVQKEGVREIAALDDVAAVGPLAQGLDFGRSGTYDHDVVVSDIAAQALIRLLPRVKASDSGVLNDDQRACLRRALGRKNRQLTLAILQALEQVGDSRDIPAVEKVTLRGGRIRKDMEVRVRAAECLLVLQQRAEQQKLASTPLRPAESPELPESVLLRPAGAEDSADSPVLLRAADSTRRPK